MRILLDESAPRALKRLLSQHEVRTAPEEGWASIRNGLLLSRAVAARFDVFVTPDQSIPDQQNLSSFDIAVVVLARGRNRMASYWPIADRLREVVANAPRGVATWVAA